MTKLVLIPALFLATLPTFAQKPLPRIGYATELPDGHSAEEKRLLATIKATVDSGHYWQNVPVTDGKLLRMLAETTSARHIVEIGTSTGLSAMWFAMALRCTGGRLTTFEYDAGRAATARNNFKEAGVDSFITLIEGDAHQNVQRIKDPIDIVFIDADKEGYVDYLEKLLPLVRPGGLILAHNVPLIPAYMKAVRSNPALETVLYSDGEGMAISLKKR